MVETPLVSVVVATHNRPQFLKKTIESILRQSFDRLELIVVSNGFSSTNEQVVHCINDSRVTYVAQPNSGGPASPRNHGIRLSKCEYIAFCDDDDLWFPDKLEKQIKALKANQDCGICYTRMVRYDDYGNEWTEANDFGPVATLKSLLFINTVPVSSIVVKADLVRKIGGYSESKRVGLSEDYDFLLKCATHSVFFLVDECLIKYYSGSCRTTMAYETSVIWAVVGTWRYTLGALNCLRLLFGIKSIRNTVLLRAMLHHLKLCAKRIICLTVLRHVRKLKR
ncbi:MAG: glycosyltransferase family 2 protein [Holosporales bacterium]|jgi:glycosyltransferase involved in cell wall biosynthesis|nr:glycosyltransferase family 2 protein [Holosporales bacterium]